MFKQKKWTFLLTVGVVIILIVFLYSLAPKIEARKYKRRFGSFDEWYKEASDPNSGYRKHLSNYRPVDEVLLNSLEHSEPIAFSSNDIQKIDKNTWIVACYGASDYYAWIGLFSRNHEINERYKLHVVSDQQTGLDNNIKKRIDDSLVASFARDCFF
ncbi:hypothetical protein [Xylanivirga thermophila]|uniref:hypothetical protein n=1 Tax=Xylanivirga thermophila TaxID=2496273 RepID=UPI0039F4F3AA